jgi:hypothetical protein
MVMNEGWASYYRVTHCVLVSGGAPGAWRIIHAANSRGRRFIFSVNCIHEHKHGHGHGHHERE